MCRDASYGASRQSQLAPELAPATIDQRRGFLLLSGEDASDPRTMQIVASAGTDVRAVGVEVEIGPREGLAHDGVVRIALPRAGHFFARCLSP
jgi:mRNA interferase MazF